MKVEWRIKNNLYSIFIIYINLTNIALLSLTRSSLVLSLRCTPAIERASTHLLRVDDRGVKRIFRLKQKDKWIEHVTARP